MKLRTEMVHMDGKWSVGVVSGFSDEAQARARKDVSHDAMAAHAYKQAIADWHEKNGTDADADVYPETTVEFIEKRADEILAGWLGEE